jgi:hypothetical protein
LFIRTSDVSATAKNPERINSTPTVMPRYVSLADQVVAITT